MVALALAVGGMVAVVASQLDPAAGIRFDLLGVGLTIGAATSQAVFVLVSRHGYRAVPADQAMTVDPRRHGRRAAWSLAVVTGAAREPGLSARDAGVVPLAARSPGLRRGDPVDPVPDRHPARRRHEGRHPDAVRAGRRRAARGLAPGARGSRRSRSLGGLAILGAALILQRAVATGRARAWRAAVEAEPPRGRRP